MDGRSLLVLVDDELNVLSSDLESCMLNEEGVEVAAVISGYKPKVTFDKSKCEVCKTFLTTVTSVLSKFNYLDKISRAGLVTPSIYLIHCVLKSFAILNCISDIIKKLSLPEQKLAEYVLSERNDAKEMNSQVCFLSRNHEHLLSKVNRIIANTYFSNEKRQLRGMVRKDSIEDFK